MAASAASTAGDGHRQACILGLNWAPDGRSLIFGHRFEMRQPDIAIRAAGAKNLARLTVAPDGQRLVFSGGRRLFVMNIDGTGRRPFGRREKWGIATPAWCRDGRTIVFARRRDRDWDLYAITTSGRVFTRVTDNLADDYEPDC
jgi:Tol biopolymer transport system component